MTTQFTVEEVTNRVEEQWDTTLNLLKQKIALASVSAQGITADHMRTSAQFVADELARLGGVETRVVQSTNPDGTPGAWEVVGSKIIDPDLPTVLLYAHHDVQPVPDPSAWDTEPFVGTVKGDRLYGRGAADDGGGIAIHAGALAALVTNSTSISRSSSRARRRWSESFIPFITAHATTLLPTSYRGRLGELVG